MIAGRLEIELNANFARLVKDMREIKQLVGGTMKDVERFVSGARTALNAFGLGISIVGIVMFTRATIDSIAKMKDLAQEAGTTAAAISRFEAPARLAGSSLESVTGAIVRMSRAAIESRDPSSKAALALRAIGVSTEEIRRMKPDEMFEHVARQLAKYADGHEKNAIMQVLFNKSGREMARVIAEIAEKQKLASTVSNEQAEAADRLQDMIVELRMEFDKVVRELAGPFIKVMTDVIRAFREAKDEGGFFKGVLAGIFTMFDNMRGKSLQDELKRVDDQIRLLKLDIESATNGIRSLTFTDGERATKAARLNELLKERARIQSAIHKMDMDAQNARALGGPNMQPKGKPTPIFDPDAERRGKIGLDLLTRLQQEYAKLNNITDKNETLERTLIELKKDGYKDISPQRRQEIIDQARLNDETREQIRLREFLMELNKQEIDAAQARGDAVEALSNSWADATEEMAQGLKLLGLSNIDRQKAILLEKARLDLVAAGKNAAAVRDINTHLQQQLQLLDQINARQNDLNIWHELSDAAGQFFSDLVFNGKDAFDNLKRWAKQLLAEMIALFAKRWILQMGANMLGGSGGAALASQAAAVGQGTLAGSAGNLLSSFLGSGLTAAGGLIGGSFGAGLTFAGSAGTLAGLAEIGAGGSALFQLGAALPGIGMALAVVGLLASIFGRKSRSKKEGGSFLGQFDASGDLISQLPGQPFADHRDLLETDAARAHALDIAGGYAGLVRAFGGNARALQFGAGFVTNPRGDAPSFAHTMVRDASGNVIFNQENRNVSRDKGALEAELKLQSQRAILAALQASEFEDGIKNILNLVVAETATEEEINTVLALATAFKQLGEMIDHLGRTPLEQLKHALGAMKDRISEADDAFRDALRSGDPTKILAAQRELETAVMDRYNQEMAMISQLRGAIRQVEEQAYQFALNIASRINAVGGSRDIGAIAMGRASQLRGRIGGNAPLQFQIEDVEGYVGAIDTWYQSRRSAIEADIAAEQKAMQAIAQAQQSAIQARISGLQVELALAQQFQGVVARAGQMIDEMRLTSLNPMSVHGRLGLATDDAAAARAAFEASSGAGRVLAANRLMDALQRRLGLLGEAFQRPSPEFQAGYNEIIAELTGLQGEARTEAERALGIQQQILDLQGQSNAIQSMVAANTSAMDSRLAALDKEALSHYEWAEREGIRLYELHRQGYIDQLTAITGGMDVEMYIAKLTKDSVDHLSAIRAGIETMNENPPTGEVTINVTVTGGGDPNEIVTTIEKNAPRIRRALASS